MRILVVGPNGLLGTAVVRTILAESDTTVLAAGRTFLADDAGYEQWDATKASAWKQLAEEKRWQADVVVNCAALTHVDRCETERRAAWVTNVELTESILNYARKADAHVIQISTDNIFDGIDGPYGIENRPEPKNYYGRTKLAAENACNASPVPTAILRTMWLYATTPDQRTTYSTWVRDTLAAGGTVKIAEDERGNPTTVEDLAYDIMNIAEKRRTGTLHGVGNERMSRMEWAEIICEVWELDKSRMTGITSADLGRPAARPLDSGLINAESGRADRAVYSTTIAAEKQAQTLLERSSQTERAK